MLKFQHVLWISTYRTIYMFDLDIFFVLLFIGTYIHVKTRLNSFLRKQMHCAHHCRTRICQVFKQLVTTIIGNPNWFLLSSLLLHKPCQGITPKAPRKSSSFSFGTRNHQCWVHSYCLLLPLLGTIWLMQPWTTVSNNHPHTAENCDIGSFWLFSLLLRCCWKSWWQATLLWLL